MYSIMIEWVQGKTDELQTKGLISCMYSFPLSK